MIVLTDGVIHLAMARQSFFRSPEQKDSGKYGAYTPDRSMTLRFKVIILVIALVGGAALGGAYSMIAANEINKQAREKLRPGKAARQREAIRKLAAKRNQMAAQWAAEAEARKQREIAERLAQSNPLKNLFGGNQATTATASTDPDESPRRPTRRTRATPKPSDETLQSVAEQARRMLQENK